MDYTHFKPPFKYDPYGGYILNDDNALVAEIRGWGLLTGTGAGGQGLGDSEADALLDALGERIASLLNADVIREAQS